MSPLAEPTPAMIRNIGAVERKKSTRVEVAGTRRRETTARGTEAADERGEVGDGQQRPGEEEAPEEDLEALMEAVAEAISQAEREAIEVQGTTTDEATVTGEDATLTGEETTLTGQVTTGNEDREAEARRRASNFFTGYA